MKDFQLYQQILGLTEPWYVENVTMNLKAQEIEVRIACRQTLWACPQCQQRMHVHDHEERRWRHLDSCQFKTILICQVPVVRCPTHGTQNVQVPWVERYSRFTRYLERLAIDLMLECSVQGACQMLRISWDEADGIKQQAVARGLGRKPKQVPARLCIDEKSATRGHEYLTIVARVQEGQTTVEYVGEDRTRASLDAYWEQFSPQDLARVQAVGMDLWDTFVQSTTANVPGAADKIVHDPFHLVRHMNEAVNEVRKNEHRRLQAAGDETLKGTRQLWLYGMENLPTARAQSFAVVKDLNLETTRAWGIKEVFRSFWLCETAGQARK